MAGTALIAAGVIALGNTAGVWKTPWYVIIPVVNGGLCLAAVTGLLARAIRRDRSARGRPGAERDEVPTR